MCRVRSVLLWTFCLALVSQLTSDFRRWINIICLWGHIFTIFCIRNDFWCRNIEFLFLSQTNKCHLMLGVVIGYWTWMWIESRNTSAVRGKDKKYFRIYIFKRTKSVFYSQLFGGIFQFSTFFTYLICDNFTLSGSSLPISSSLSWRAGRVGVLALSN